LQGWSTGGADVWRAEADLIPALTLADQVASNLYSRCDLATSYSRIAARYQICWRWQAASLSGAALLPFDVIIA
jgi:hypothetical protein